MVDQFTLLFMVLFLICIYYLFRINECSNKFNHLRNAFSRNIHDNITLSNKVDKYQLYNPNSNGLLETYQNYGGNLGPGGTNSSGGNLGPGGTNSSGGNLGPGGTYQGNSGSSSQYPVCNYPKNFNNRGAKCNNPSVDINPKCMTNDQHNPQKHPSQPGYSEIVQDNCSIPQYPSHPQPTPVSQCTQEDRAKKLKKVHNHIKKGLCAYKKLKKKENQEKRKQQCQARTQMNGPGGRAPSNNSLNPHHLPLISPCYNQYQSCINGGVPHQNSNATIPKLNYSNNNSENKSSGESNEDCVFSNNKKKKNTKNCYDSDLDNSEDEDDDDDDNSSCSC